jgi:hypothetical protein
LAGGRDDSPNHVPCELFVHSQGSGSLRYAPYHSSLSSWIEDREAERFLDATDVQDQVPALPDQSNDLIVDGDDPLPQLLEPFLGRRGRIRISAHPTGYPFSAVRLSSLHL